MRVAVTGATGFIGQHIIAELMTRSVEIVAITRKNPAEIYNFPQTVNIVQLDIKDVTTETFEQIGNPDVLIHLAWGTLFNFMSPLHVESELPLHHHFLKQMIQSGLRSLFVAGTCLEYGMQSGSLNEDMDTHPVTPYGFSKDILRRHLEYLRLTNDFSMTWGRLFYLYGDGQERSSLLPQLTRAVKCGDSIFNMSGGEQLRDYLPVTAAANYIVSLALQKKNIGVINICSGKPVTVRSLVEKWIAENGWHIKLNPGYYPYPDYEPMSYYGDRKKLDLDMILP